MQRKHPESRTAVRAPQVLSVYKSVMFVHLILLLFVECKKDLQQGGFFIRDQRLYCPEDYQSDFGVKCAACQNYVEGEVVTVLDKVFHTKCFRCSACRHLFSSGERTTIFDEAYYCVDCADRLADGVQKNHSGAETSPTGGSPFKARATPDGHGGLDLNPVPVWTQKAPTAMLSTLPTHPHLQPASTTSGLTNGLRDPYPFVDGQLTVQIHQNGYSSCDADGRKIGLSPVHIDTPGERSTTDPLSTHTPGQTYSGGCFTISGSEQRRVCPPGVDYGRHYPVSYLQLAERGLTAIMSVEEIPLQSEREHALRTRSLMRTDFHTPVFHRLSRRDVASSSGTRFTSPSNGGLHTDYKDSVDSSAKEKFHTLTSTASRGYSITGSRTATASLCARPRRDLYVRCRELSPGSASLSSGAFGYRTHLDGTGSSVLPPDTHWTRDRISPGSTPNVRGKRGMAILAESLIQPRPRRDRSLSPDSAAVYWAEARRLASYPNARIPDSTSLPAIERFDFPAPPSPAVVMMEKRREKRMADQLSSANVVNGDASFKSSKTETGDFTDSGASHVPSKLHQIDMEIETLKRLGESSGITAALIQELEASKLLHARSPDLDPVSASRSPSANTEPGYKTRYEQHMHASPSRDTRRDRRTAHTLSYRMDYSVTGGRSGTIPSFTSIPRPGYTMGTLHSRAISLPRPLAVDAAGDTFRGTHANGAFSTSLLRGSRSMQSGPQAQTEPPTGLSTCASSTMGDGDHTITRDHSLQTFGVFDSNVTGAEGVGSLATSAMSMDGLTLCSGADDGTMVPSGNAYVLKSGTVPGLPHSVTGLRPVRALLKNRSLHGSSHGRTRPSVRRGSGQLISDSELTDLDAYPSVQSWLRHVAPHKPPLQKFYRYDQLKVSAGRIPKGLERTRLETYLEPTEFESIFGMSSAAFQRLPEWKRNDLKKNVDLI
ncbi:unnamed protein product [Dicrocoelium dendriticum]|nr:unnamed protein product [Dicrocoelium dendriticum]